MAKKRTREDHLAIAEAYNNLRRFPDYATLSKHLGMQKATIKRWANKYLQMREEDDSLPPLIDRDVESFSELERTYDLPKPDYDHLGGPGRYVITAAQYGARVNVDVLAALKHYCHQNNAKLVVLPIQYGITWRYNKKKNIFELVTQISSYITDDPDITVIHENVEGVMLNSNIMLNTMRLRPTLVNPLSSLGPSGEGVSRIFAGPKMNLEPIAVSNNSIPKVNMTTGAVTFPRYRNEKTGRIAVRDHCFGAVVVEVENDEFFHYRQLLANKEGEFYDIDLKKYTPKGVQDAPDCVDSLILGDFHSGETDPQVREATFGKGGLVEHLKPEYIVLHDFHNGDAINHHEANKAISMARKAKAGKLCLKREMELNVADIRYMLENSPSCLVFVKSNHDEFTDRWLDDLNRAAKDPHNWESFLELSLLKVRTEDYGAGAFALYAKNQLTEEECKRVIFLSRDEDFVRHGIKLDMHGDKGANGSRGNIQQFNKLSLRTITGHTHTPGIFGSAWRVGTNSRLRLAYNDGPSNWMHTDGIVFKNGQRMLINFIDGRFFMAV